MRTAIVRLMALAALLTSLFALPLRAQWEPERRLTYDDSSSLATLNYARSVAVSGERVHVVWYDNRDGQWGINYKRSSDGGNTWGRDTSLEKGTFQVRFPSMAVSGTRVHVVWEERQGKVSNVFTKGSPDGGLTWGPERQLTQDTMDSVCPAVVVSKATVHVVWQDYHRDPLMPGISYRRSTDGGKTWGPETGLCRDQVFSNHPSIAASGQEVHVVWEWGARRAGIFKANYRRSTDGGKTWKPAFALSPDTVVSWSPSITSTGSGVHAVWEEKKGKTFDLCYRRSTDGGKTWESETVLAQGLAGEPLPTIAASGSQACIVWTDKRNGNWEIYAKTSADGGKTWGPEARLTQKTADSRVPSAAISGSKVHVAWSDKRDGNWEIYYKRNITGK